MSDGHIRPYSALDLLILRRKGSRMSGSDALRLMRCVRYSVCHSARVPEWTFYGAKVSISAPNGTRASHPSGTQ